MGYDFVKDVNGQNQLGFTHLQATLQNATRWKTAKAFLNPAKNRRNLHVMKYAQAMKINIDPNTKRANGVKLRDA